MISSNVLNVEIPC